MSKLQRTPEEIQQFLGEPLFDWQILWLMWYTEHSDCGGKFVTYFGKNEFRIGCTCEDKD